jgi:hypothetical protein
MPPRVFMRPMDAVLEAIQSSPLAELLAGERWGAANSKQILETLHFIAFALQIGAVMVLSWRLLGFGRSVPIAALSRPVFWTAWLGFAAVFLTGALQFVPIATEVFHRPSFRAKLVIVALALATLGWLHAQVRRSASAWDAGAAVPGSLKVVAGLSLALWPTVVIVARLMYAFVQMTGP